MSICTVLYSMYQRAGTSVEVTEGICCIMYSLILKGILRFCLLCNIKKIFNYA